MIDAESVTYMVIGSIVGTTIGVYLHFNGRDLLTLARVLAWLSVGLFVRLLRRFFPNMGGEYVFYYVLILPHYNESSEDSEEINFSVENNGESIHNITVRQEITRQVAVEKEIK